MSDPFRSHDVAVAARAQQVLDEIGVLRERLGAYEGVNRAAVVAGQLEWLRADIQRLLGTQEDLTNELRRIQFET